MDAQVEYLHEGLWVKIRFPKGTVILSRMAWIEGIRRGKSWLRREKAEKRENADLERKASKAFPHVS